MVVAVNAPFPCQELKRCSRAEEERRDAECWSDATRWKALSIGICVSAVEGRARLAVERDKVWCAVWTGVYFAVYALRVSPDWQ